MKVLLHFNYLKVWWPGSRLQGLRKLHPQWERAFSSLTAQCPEKNEKRWQGTRRAIARKEAWEIKMGEFGSHWISVTLKSWVFFSSSLFLLSRSGGRLLKAVQPGAGSQWEEEGALLLSLLVSPVLLWRNEIHIQTFEQNSTLKKFFQRQIMFILENLYKPKEEKYPKFHCWITTETIWESILSEFLSR